MNVLTLLLLSGALAAGQAPEEKASEKQQPSAPAAKAEAPPADSVPSPAKAEKKKGKSSLDDDLFGDLTGDLFEGLDRPKLTDPPKPETKQPAGKEKKQPAGSRPRSDDLLPGQLGQGEDLGQEGDPLIELGQRMRRVEQLIAEAKTGQGTQKMQDEIVRDLQKMIEIARQQCSSSSSQSSSSRKGSKSQSDIKTAANRKGSGDAQPSPRPKGSDANVREGKVSKPKSDPAAMAGDKHIWGLLPQHMQQAIMNAQSQRFLDEYDQEIKDYFTRLAELFQQGQQR